MISNKKISDLREKLLERRKEIFEFRRTVNTSWQSLHEPEKELEESASKETMSAGLAQLDDRGQAEIREIDHALTKMDEGKFGKCEACRRPISLKRLQVVPWARQCVQCAGLRESFAGGGIESPAVSLDKETLTDDDMQETIHDALQTDGRVDMEELDISCENGVVYLSGVLPSDSEHEILLEIINDKLDFDETVDNIKIDRQPWERRERTPAPTPVRSQEEIMMEGEDEQVDAYTSLSEGEPMTPPDELVPEERRSGHK
jgi:RNA polymerase-binding transcription factor DksA